MKCGLCRKEKVLRNSHIIPEFLYAHCYDDKHRMKGITGTGNRGDQTLQQGIREHLLCDNCECFLNENYEKPFNEYWCDQRLLPKKVSDQIELENIDYPKFKLFHLSILFRCAMAREPTFQAVDLFGHEFILRRMLREHNPGSEDDFPLMGTLALNDDRTVNWGLIHPPVITSLGGEIVYIAYYGGCQWFYILSRKSLPHFRNFRLRSEGKMVFNTQYWKENGILRQCGQLLRDVDASREYS